MATVYCQRCESDTVNPQGCVLIGKPGTRGIAFLCSQCFTELKDEGVIREGKS